ncbi:MAG: dihydropteroate synthase [Balneolaceae bacterium]
MTQTDSPNLLQLPGTTLSLNTPKVMGILNVTPDSFSDGGEFNSLSKSIDRIGEMLEEGASIIDVGGESTRPGSEPVLLKDEINRVIPVIEKAKSEYPEAIFSVDTTKYEVAETALKLGVHLLNDVSGLQKVPEFAGLCAKYNAGYILMHSQGDPKTMQKNPSYNDVISEIYLFFEKKLKELNEAGVSSLILDPGIGFGKTLDHNIQIIAGLQKFSKLRHPILIGASRKSMIGKILNNRPVEGRLAGTIALHYHALMNGAGILRVHDVREAADSIRVFNSITHH